MPIRRARRDPRPPAYRAEIQGLRALAVCAVILHHLTGWPRGGFVGVDVFFVISGFLITGLLLSERRATGAISFSGFYRRRIRRLLPAAVLVLAATVLVSFSVVNAAQGKQTLVDGIWSLLFSANWHFAWAGTDYFQAGAAQSPLEHFWSLAVEEQFYLLWPCLLVASYALVSRRVPYASRIGHRLAGVIMAVIVLGSFAYACWLTVSNPTWAYFSTFARIWELGVGALLAVAATSLAALPAAWRPALAWLGLAGIGASYLVVDPTAPVLGTWGTLPVLSTALVIAAGTGGRPRYLRPLTHPIPVWLGELSYSLYLWHFPVIVLMTAVLPAASLQYYVATGVVLLALSVAAFYVVEDPIRRSGWLASPSVSKASRMPWPVGRSRLRLVGVGSFAACLMLFGVAMTVEQQSSAASTAVQPPEAAQPLANPTQEASAQAVRSAATQAALSATKWPNLRPSLGELDKAAGSSPCLQNYGTPRIVDAGEIRRRCLHGDPAAEHTVLVVGDSLANSYVPALTAAVANQGWNVIGVTRGGCPAFPIEMLHWSTRLPYEDCSRQQQLIPRWIADLKPDLVVVSSSSLLVRNLLASGAEGAEALAQWRKAAEAALAQYAEAAPVVVLEGPPLGDNLRECASRFSKPTDCTSTPPADYVDFRKAEKKAVKAVADPNVRYVKTQDWFCSAELRCPAFVGNTPTFVDGLHLTAEAAESLGPLMAAALRPSMDA